MEWWNTGVLGNLFKSSKVQGFNRIVLGFLFFFFTLDPLNLELAFAQANFYAGKTVTVVVGSAPGGLYDIWARLFARNMGKYIPGNPTMLVQNMPGGGSMIAANYLYGIAKPDGLTIGMYQTHMYLEQLIGRPLVKYDVRSVESATGIYTSIVDKNPEQTE
ncbi:MAG: hypothetical protein ACXWXX_16875, partial [Candidatus Binatia bacterium]